MWIVRLALRRPYTFVVVSLLILILGSGAIIITPKDIFPYIDIPVVSIIWSFQGLPPDEMEKRIVTVSERAMTTTVNDIEHIESQSYNGVAVIKVYFQPTAKVELAISQITSIMQTILRILPPGTTSPLILKYDASSVPILQLSLSGEGMTESQLYDLGTNFVRTQLATVEGASVPLPYGGKQRQIMVDIDPNLLYAKHLSATDVSNAMNAQNLILPAGTAKVGDREYEVKLNSSPSTVDGMNNLPIRAAGGAVVFIKDVAQVRDGFAVQTSIVRTNGARSALLTVLKNGKASTLSIVKAVKEALPRIASTLPSQLKITPLFDQSIFVRASMYGVLREAGIAAFLTALMILLFLGSWRSTLIVCTSIPLAILTSIIILTALGETINVMTLGGLALAVGILVDDATVEIENVHRNMAMKKPLTRAILDGAQQIAVPTLVSTLAICIVFVPVVMLTGAARYLFTPLAMAVVFAMLASYFLSRTLVPTMVHYLLGPELPLYTEEHPNTPEAKSFIWRVHEKFEHKFDAMRDRYKSVLDFCLHHRVPVLIVFGIFALASASLVFLVGEDFFPYVDSGQMRLHVRAPQGTRIEETEQIFAGVEQEIRHAIPEQQIDMILDNIGIPPGGVNLGFSDINTIGDADGDILISLKPGHSATRGFMRQVRANLEKKFPEETFFFTAANITNQILNFGRPQPIDVQVVGRNADQNYKVAKELETKISQIPGAVDVHVHQEVAAPELDINVDRSRAQQVGLTQRDVASSMLISLSGSFQTAPNQWVNPQNGVNYQVVVQTPPYKMQSLDDINQTPVTTTGVSSTQLLSNLATVKRSVSPAIVNHYNVQPIFDVYADADQRDLGGVAKQVQKIMSDQKKNMPQGSYLELRGQVETMQQSFSRLTLGIGFAVIFVYLLMAVNFQSWIDPFIILTALPGAFAGIAWMLFVTQTTLSVPSLMGAIMTIGVATANSILLVTFANDERADGKSALEAALSAGFTRLRPVCMTALAMIIGMAPMALALGEGGEQNAPLGRAVIGGLLLATVSTLIIVPIVYSLLRKKAPVDYDKKIDEEAHQKDMNPQAA
jgi:CzcA family heavy metal efflux pump